MSVIKFRSWDEKSQSFSYWWVNDEGRINKDYSSSSRQFDWSKAQQFTGAYDKRGNEIYVGDIVRFGTELVYHEVVFRKYGFQLAGIEDGLTMDKHYFLGNVKIEELEVVDYYKEIINEQERKL